MVEQIKKGEVSKKVKEILKDNPKARDNDCVLLMNMLKKYYGRQHNVIPCSRVIKDINTKLFPKFTTIINSRNYLLKKEKKNG